MKPESIYTLAAVVVLFVGVLVYVFDRRPEHVYFLPEYFSFAGSTGRLFGQLGNYLPTFAHVYAFILLTKVVLGVSSHRLLPVCLFWFVVDSLFEFGQFPAIAASISQVLATGFDGIPVLENSARYFQAGRFDWLDMLSIGIGAIAAWVTMFMITYKENNHVDYQKSTRPVT